MKYALACFAIVCLGLAYVAFASDSPPSARYRVVLDDEWVRQEAAEIKSEMGRLQTELDGLKRRLKALEETRKLRIQSAPAPGLSAKPVPPDWGRREFNGREYYIIPLAKESRPGRD